MTLLLLAFPWFLSAVNITVYFLAGRKTVWAWYAALGGCVAWGLYSWCSGLWGFFPATVVIFVVSLVNLRKWLHDDQKKQSVRVWHGAHVSCPYCNVERATEGIDFKYATKDGTRYTRETVCESCGKPFVIEDTIIRMNIGKKKPE